MTIRWRSSWVAIQSLMAVAPPTAEAGGYPGLPDAGDAGEDLGWSHQWAHQRKSWVGWRTRIGASHPVTHGSGPS